MKARLVVNFSTNDPKEIEELEEMEAKIMSGEFQRDMTRNHNVKVTATFEMYGLKTKDCKTQE